ncbi:ATP-binding protein [Metabacillus litoralis]|uniref:ATP-binding protein n=1 Tax=Metabacillus litoralis TaxID=152268 RepID=UPI001CFCDBE0|nr:AAA family ATPase [Metabacillus litoralis]
MKIKRLMIYGYGKFENKDIEFQGDTLQVVYGENEAGKSTIMSFIHSILFGFPTKQQTENRYEPKHGAAYGGYLVVEDHNRLVKIERLPGKNGGNVTIELDDGTSKGEDYLQTLMSGIDKETYRSIFSFDVHGLQQIQKMNSDQIGKYLFLSSIYGADTLFAIEDKLVKQRDSLYKPNGKKPELNEGLDKLKKSHNQVLEAKRQNNEYQELLKMKEELYGELTLLVNKKRNSSKKQRELEKIISVLPLLNDLKWCIDQLASLPDSAAYPEDGLKQLDQLIMTLQPMEAQLHSLKSKREKILLEEAALSLDENLISILPKVQHGREQLPVYEEKKKRIIQLQQKISKIQHEISLYKQRIFPAMKEEEILQINATIQMKESIKKSARLDQQLQQRKKMLDEQFDQTKANLEESENKIRNFKEELLLDEERRKLEEKVNKEDQLNIKQLKNEKQQILSEINIRKDEFKKEKKQRTTIVSLITVLLLTCSLFFMLEKNWLIAGMFVVSMFFSLFILKTSIGKKDSFLHHLTSKLTKLEEVIDEGEKSSFSSNSSILSETMLLLEKDNTVKHEIHHEQLLSKQYEKTYEKIVKQYEEWEEDQFQSSVTFNKLLNHFRIDKKVTPETLLEAFELLQQLQQLILEKKQYEGELTSLQQDVYKFEHKISELMKVAEISNVSSEQALYEMSRMCQNEKEKQEMLEKHNERRVETEDAIRILREKVNYLTKQKEELIKSSTCETEDEFRKLAKIHKEREELLKQKLWIEKQLATERDMKIEFIQVNSSNELEADLIEVEKELDKLEKNEKETQQRYSEIVVKIKEIEQNGTYSRQRHSFENDKATIREKASQWIVGVLANDLLKKTIERHREEKLPAVVHSIGYYFSKLTSNSYKNVYLPDGKQSFIVERNDGVKFFAEELSQATAEQLYLSIRLALVKNINEQLHLPIIIDDSFVHFDQQRTSNILRMMDELKQENQVIYFTCHKHIATTFSTKNMINLSKVHVI